MRKNVFTKKFDDKESLDKFINNCVGECHYYDIRPNNVNIDVVVNGLSSYFKNDSDELLKTFKLTSQINTKNMYLHENNGGIDRLSRYDNVTPYITVGPSEFLNLVKNAKVVCGASFHLMVFSILFNKDFYCMNGDVDSRMNNLMKVCGCEDRIWSVVNTHSNRICSKKSIDYNVLAIKRDISKKIIYNAF